MMTKNDVIEKLKKLIENNINNQGIALYNSTIDILKGTISNSIIKNLYNNYSGYLARGEFTKSEYDNLLEIINCLKDYEDE